MFNTLIAQNCNHIIIKPAGKEISSEKYLIVYKMAKYAAMLKAI